LKLECNSVSFKIQALTPLYLYLIKRIISKRVDDPKRIQGFKDSGIRVKCLKYKENLIFEKSLNGLVYFL